MTLTNALVMMLAAAPVTAYATYCYRRRTAAKRKQLADERELYDTLMDPLWCLDPKKTPPMPPVQQPRSPGLPGKRRRTRRRRSKV